MRSSRIQRTIKADAKRRLSLGKLIDPGSQWRAVKEPDGRITLHPVSLVTPGGSPPGTYTIKDLPVTRYIPEEERTTTPARDAATPSSNYIIDVDGEIKEVGTQSPDAPLPPNVIRHHYPPTYL